MMSTYPTLAFTTTLLSKALNMIALIKIYTASQKKQDT